MVNVFDLTRKSSLIIMLLCSVAGCANLDREIRPAPYLAVALVATLFYVALSPVGSDPSDIPTPR